MPESGATVPQNVPGFPFSPGWRFPSSDIDGGTVEAVTLEDGAGNVVATSLERAVQANGFGRLIVPSAPLAPGAYTLGFIDPCAGGSQRQTRTFTITEPKPFPTELGSLRATAPAMDPVLTEAGSACVASLKAVSVRVEIEPSPSFAAYQPVATYSVSVDGQPWRGPVSDYEQYSGPPRTFDPLVVFAACEKSRYGRSAPDPGKHTIEVRAHIEGAPADPAPATIEIDLPCPSDPTPTSSIGQGGCSVVSHPEPVSSGAVAATLAAIGLVLRTRRRRRD